jgi:hypothetical protein
MRRRFFLTGLVVVAAAALIGCASGAPSVRASEKLYLAIEVSEDGRRVASPKLLGFEGHSVTAERRAPGAAEPEYRLILRPEEQGTGYRVLLDLELPSGRRLGKVGLLHGEERTVLLDQKTQLKLMLMRVDSPEFRALMQTRPKSKTGAI